MSSTGGRNLEYTEKTNAQIGLLAFYRSTNQSNKPGNLFLQSLRHISNETNKMQIEKRDKREV